MHMCGHRCWGSQKHGKSLELRLQEAVSHLVWYWELNSHLLQEQCLLLTIEPSFQPQESFNPTKIQLDLLVHVTRLVT